MTNSQWAGRLLSVVFVGVGGFPRGSSDTARWEDLTGWPVGFLHGSFALGPSPRDPTPAAPLKVDLS